MGLRPVSSVCVAEFQAPHSQKARKTASLTPVPRPQPTAKLLKSDGPGAAPIARPTLYRYSQKQLLGLETIRYTAGRGRIRLQTDIIQLNEDVAIKDQLSLAKRLPLEAGADVGGGVALLNLVDHEEGRW